MSITTKDTSAAAVTYNHFRTQENRATYIGPVHSDISKDMLIVQSSSPKRSGSSFGNRRSSINLVQSVDVVDAEGATVTKDMKVELSISIPAGVTTAQLAEACARIEGIISDDTNRVDILHIGKIDV